MAKKKVGKYVIDMNKKIGEGTFAKVYEAIHATTNQAVAVKILDKAKVQQCDYSQNAFKQEIDIMVRLKGQNIIKFLEVNQSKTNYYIFLELAEGGQLRKKLKKNGLPQKETLEYLIQLMNGFAQISRIGVIHRDLKPDNIFIKNGILKIGDFGFSKDAGASGVMTTIVGSPAYMAPQIALEQKYTYKCDIWSLGIMAYEMMTGQIPKITQNEDILFPQDIQVSKDMKNFINGCLKDSQQQRFGWTQLFLHPLFKGIFNKKFQGMQKGQERLGYLMASIRMNIHQSKTDVKNLVKSFKKQQITTQEFRNLLSYLDSGLNDEDTKIVANLLEKDNKVKFKDFEQLLEKYGCQLQHLDQIIKDVDTESESKKVQSYMIDSKLARRNLKKSIQAKNIDFNDLFKKLTNNEKEINFSQFSTLLTKILAYIPQSQIQHLYSTNFGTPIDKSLSFEKFNTIMTQMVGK